MASKSRYINSLFEDFLGINIPNNLTRAYFLSGINAESFDSSFSNFLCELYSLKSFSSRKSIRIAYLIFLDRNANAAELIHWEKYLSSNSYESFLNIISSCHEASLQVKYLNFKNCVIQALDTAVPTISKINTLIDKGNYSIASHLLSYTEYFKLSPVSLINQKKWELSSHIPKKKFYIDITLFYIHRSKTGIQRVVNKIFESFYLSSLNGNEFEVLPVAIIDDNIIVLRDYILEKSNIFITSCINYTPNLGVNDVLLLLDLNPNLASAVNTHKIIKESKIFVWGIVYDLLPIFNPSWWPEGAQKNHLNWFQTLYSLSHGYSCISNEVLRTTREIVSAMNWPYNNKKGHSFNLGSDFVDSSTLGYSVKRRKEPSKSTVFLTVGTIEPRKGHYDIFNAFKKLMQTNHSAILHIVGKYGWLMDEFEDIFNRLKKLYPNNIFWHKKCSDEELNQLYSDCDCLIQASYDEGYGLPIVEAISKSKLIICRDIPVFREVGNSYPLYFDNNKVNQTLFDICQTVCNKTFDPPLTDSAKDRLISWDTSRVILAEQILSEYNTNFLSSIPKKGNPSSIKDLSKVIYIYIGHTVSYKKVSGIQDVVRQIVSGITNHGFSIVLLGWNEETSNLEVLNKNQLDFFLNNTRHTFNLKYILNLTATTFTLDNIQKSNSVLIMPELAYHSSERYDICSLLSSCFSRYFNKSICIYYDAIPLIYPLYSDLALSHYNYICSLKFYDKILSISEFSKSNLLELLDKFGIHLNNSDQLFTVPLGTNEDTQIPAISHESRLPSSSPYILAVGSMVPHKNWLTLVTAYSLFRKRSLSLHSEVPKLYLISAASPENIEIVDNYDDVQLLSSINEDDIYKAYSDSLFCVFPSTLEGFGLPILEASQFSKISLFHQDGAPYETASYSSLHPLCGCDMTDPFQISNKLEWLCRNNFVNLKTLENSFSSLTYNFNQSSYADRLLSFI